MYTSANVSDKNIYTSLINLLVTGDVMLSGKCKDVRKLWSVGYFINPLYITVCGKITSYTGVEEATEN